MPKYVISQSYRGGYAETKREEKLTKIQKKELSIQRSLKYYLNQEELKERKQDEHEVKEELEKKGNDKKKKE